MLPARLRALLPAALLLAACGSRSDLLPTEPAATETRPDPDPDPDPDPPGPVTVACGDYHSCAARRGGPAYCWGSGSQGQLGGGRTLGVTSPVLAGVDDVEDLAAGWWHTCAVRRDGRVFCWGSGGTGQLGNGDLDDRTTPVETLPVPPAQSVCAGMTYTCALTDGGEVWCWGGNLYGELGVPERLTSTPTPAPVPGIDDAVQLACGHHHACAVMQDGELRCWGWNVGLQVAPGLDSMPPTTVPDIADAREVSAGYSVTCARLGSGAVRCWGGGQSKVTFGWPPVDVIAQGGALSLDARGTSNCATTTEGAACWGFSSQIVDASPPGTRDPVLIPGAEEATMIGVGGTVGESHACVVLAGDRLACWGRNSEGQVGDGTNEHRDAPVPVALP